MLDTILVREKDAERERMQKEIDAFLKGGGKIQTSPIVVRLETEDGKRKGEFTVRKR